MKTIIAGSRVISHNPILEEAVKESGFKITEVVSGCAAGVDWMGELWAIGNKVPIKRFRANWKQEGRAAGPIRNRKMAEYADQLIAIWDGRSRGTKNMIDEAEKRGLRV